MRASASFKSVRQWKELVQLRIAQVRSTASCNLPLIVGVYVHVRALMYEE